MIREVKITELNGLSEPEVISLQKKFGKNVFKKTGLPGFARIFIGIVTEPMFILLVIACLLYFILGENEEGAMMVVAILIVTGISIYQENRSGNALKALADLTQPGVKVIRGGVQKILDSRELVPGDIILLEEGDRVPADSTVIQANDISVNESILTGESFPVDKSPFEKANELFQGTEINSGKCLARVKHTGDKTVLSGLGKASMVIMPAKTLLQQQVMRFVKKLAFFGVAGFIIIFGMNYLKTSSFTESLLFGLTLAMAAIPEEIPVAFSSFMALGAFHLSRLGIISRQPQTIENLGAVSVICLDKTGTITENKMEVRIVYDYNMDAWADLNETSMPGSRLLFYAMLASETDPFDSMEKAIVEAYEKHSGSKAGGKLQMIHEYPLEGQPPMMTHVFLSNDRHLVAGKGAVERVTGICGLNEITRKKIAGHVHSMATKGYRVLAVSSADHAGDEFPKSQNEFDWKFEGLLGFYDPPKKNISEVLGQLKSAGINIKLLTGDFPETAVNIAAQAGIMGNEKFYSGEEVLRMNNDELRMAVKEVNIFARMFPNAKLKVIEALKTNGEIVAMTGDGVNDGPALKASHIGIAMGRKGTEIARQASDLVLTDDDLQKLAEAVRHGRRIHSNLKKAIRYIISIHIPIILTAALPVILAWEYPNIFTPIHVIFLELIMGPTCSIFFEREPVEENIMQAPPRKRTTGLFVRRELLESILQGLVITAGVLTLYYSFMRAGHSVPETRMIVFTTLVISNIFLTFVNRSFTETLAKTLFYKNNLAPFIILASVTFLALIHGVPAVRELFQVTPVTVTEFLLCAGVAMASVLWFEVYKSGLKRDKHPY